MKTCQYLEVKHFSWRNVRPFSFATARRFSFRRRLKTRTEREVEERENDPLKSDDDRQPLSDVNPDVDVSTGVIGVTNIANTAANTAANAGKEKRKRPGVIRRGTKRVFKQFYPHDFTAFQWGGTTSFTAYFTVVLLLSLFLAAELNPFYLKYLLWMEPSHPIVILRLIGIFLCGLPAVRELYTYMNDSRYVHIYNQYLFPEGITDC